MTEKNNKKSLCGRSSAALRTRTCVEYIEAGLTPAEVYRYQQAGKLPNWNVTQRSIENYFKKATTLIKEATIEDAQYYMNLNLKRLNKQYGKANSAGNIQAANQIIRTINEMLNINERADIGTNAQVVIIDDITTD